MDIGSLAATSQPCPEIRKVYIGPHFASLSLYGTKPVSIVETQTKLILLFPVLFLKRERKRKKKTKFRLSILEGEL